MRKFRSELYEAIYEETMAHFEIGVISEDELREFEADAFIEIVNEDADEVAEERISLSQ